MSASSPHSPLPPCATDAPAALRRAYHDMCGEDDMPAAIEMGKHHYAHACEDYNCNVALPCCDASIGSEWDGESVLGCDACAAGRYDGDGSPLTPCEDCGAGKYNPQNGSTSVAACLDCPAGRFTGGAAMQFLIGTLGDSSNVNPSSSSGDLSKPSNHRW